MPRLRTAALALCAAFAGGCVHLPATTPDRVDTLTFVIGSTATWPRSGTQAQDQLVDLRAREVCWVKYGRASAFECWRWDDQWIYHAVDHAVDGQPGESYRFSDGRWLPRYLRVGETWDLDIQGNAQTWLTPSCKVDPTRTHRFPYRLHVSWLRAQDLGADLGVRDVLVLDCAPHAAGKPATGPPERFYLARGAGWFARTSDRGVARFDRVAGAAMVRTAACAGGP